MAPGSTSNYITTTTAFTVNSNPVTLRGNSAISFSSTPSAFILQQVTVFNLTGTFYAFTTANGF